MIRQSVFALVCSLLVWGAAYGKEDREGLRHSFEKAREAENRRAEGLPGFQLSGDIRIWVSKDKEIDGLYTYFWIGNGRWKQELVLPGYRRVRVGNGKNYWQVRTTEMENPSIFELTELLSMDSIPGIEIADELKKARGEKIRGTESDCVKRSVKGEGAQKFCFARDSGALLEIVDGEGHSAVEWKLGRREYEDYASWQGKAYPRTIRGYNGTDLLTEVRFAEIKALPSSPTNFLEQPKEATEWLECAAERAWKVDIDKSKPPTYPSEARASHTQGTVMLYAVITEDGHVTEVALANNADKNLVSAAAAAVRNWIYSRTDACPGAKGKSETMISVIFSIRR
jgi:TonB family protein